MIADTGAGIYACKASTDLFELGEEDLIDQVMDIITVGSSSPWPPVVRSSSRRARWSAVRDGWSTGGRTCSDPRRMLELPSMSLLAHERGSLTFDPRARRSHLATDAAPL